MKKLLPVVQRHGKRLTETIDQRIGSETSAVVEGTRCAAKRHVLSLTVTSRFVVLESHPRHHRPHHSGKRARLLHRETDIPPMLRPYLQSILAQCHHHRREHVHSLAELASNRSEPILRHGERRGQTHPPTADPTTAEGNGHDQDSDEEVVFAYQPRCPHVLARSATLAPAAMDRRRAPRLCTSPSCKLFSSTDGHSS